MHKKITMGFIHGLLFRLSSLTFKDFKQRAVKYEHYTKSNFLNLYNEHITAMDMIAIAAKIYIVENWKNVKDWSNLNIKILDNTNKITEYYNYINDKPLRNTKSKTINDLLVEIDIEDRKKHNPIVSIDNVFLDTSDEDFSICINGKDHFWISNNNVILIADYIEKNQ